ncbi:15999_t:CDS:2, partial [Funneliformis geosporum]
ENTHYKTNENIEKSVAEDLHKSYSANHWKAIRELFQILGFTNIDDKHILSNKDSIADYYSKIKRCNNIVNLCKSHLQCVFFDELTTENKKHIAKSGFYHVYDLDKVVEMLIRAEKENMSYFITAFSDYLR